MANKKHSPDIKVWRHKTKEWFIAAFKGKCTCCGYKKCKEALEFHHLDAKKKDFSLNSVEATEKNWLGLIEELRKCIMVCANCHREIHAGKRKVPNNPIRFNENYASRDSLVEKEKHLHNKCPVCSELKLRYKKTCSYKCAAKFSNSIDWEDYDLYDLYFEKQMNPDEIAELIGCSTSSVRFKLVQAGYYHTLLKTAT